MIRDRHGNTMSVRNVRAARHFDQALIDFHRYRNDPLAALNAALTEAPDFAMAHAMKAGLLTTTSEQGAAGVLTDVLETAKAHAERGNERERAHLAAAQAWSEGDFHEAARRYGEIAMRHPRDLLALQLAHIHDFFLGQATALRDRPTQVLRAWSRTETARGLVLGMQAFGLEECGDYVGAEAAAEQAMQADPGDGWAVHALVHVLEMRGRHEQGAVLIERTAPDWHQGSFFAYHLWWHLALFRLEDGDFASALKLYDERIRNTRTNAALELVDATALLWRLRLRGVDVGARFASVADSWQALGDRGYYAFNDVHALMSYYADGRVDVAARQIAALTAASAGSDTNATMSRDVGIPLARAFNAFEQGEYGLAQELLSRVRPIAQRFGGSHAQRDLINLTLIEAALRGGDRAIALALAAERLALKPESPLARQFTLRAQELSTADAIAA